MDVRKSADEVCVVAATMYLASPPHSRISFFLDNHGIDDDMVLGYNNVSTSRWKTFQRLTGAQQTMTHHDMKNGAISMQMSGIRWLSSVPLRAAIRPGQLLAISQSSLSDNTPHLVDTTGDPHRECPPASSAVT